MKQFLKTTLAITWKDLASELRSRELLPAMLVFALLVVLIFNFALRLDPQARRSDTAGILWVTFAFAGALGLNRSLAAEKDRGCLDGLLLAPLDRSAIYFGKWLSNLAFMLLVEAVVLPVYSLLYAQNLFRPSLIGVLLLGSVGYTAAGTLLAGMAIHARTRELLLPVLFFPVVLPILIAAIEATNGCLQGLPLSDFSFWVNLLVGYDLLVVVIASLVFEMVVEE